MCLVWRWLARLRSARANWTRTAPIAEPVVDGSSALPASDTEIQPEPISGSAVGSDDVLLERARLELHDSIEKYMKLAYPDPGVLSTLDWLLVAENVMTDDDETRMLHPAVSKNATSWWVAGATIAAVKHFSGAAY